MKRKKEQTPPQPPPPRGATLNTQHQPTGAAKMETGKSISREQKWEIEGALDRAIRRGEIDVLEHLISTPELDVDMNRQFSSGRTWFHIAAASGSDEAVKFLLSSKTANVDLTVQDARGRTALHAACEDGRFRNLEQIMSSGNETLDVTIKDEDGNTPFHLVCGCTKGDQVLVWVEDGELQELDINARQQMIRALSQCHTQILNPAIQNNAGDTGHHIACRDDMLLGVIDEAILTLIVDHLHKEVIPNYNLDQLTVIKNGDAIDRLIKLCPNPYNIQNNDGDTPLHVADIANFSGGFRVVLESDIIDMTLQNKHGDTALHNLCKVGGIATLKLFLESELCKTDLSIQNLKGQTPLDIAVANGHDNCVTYLTEASRKKVT